MGYPLSDSGDESLARIFRVQSLSRDVSGPGKRRLFAERCTGLFYQLYPQDNSVNPILTWERPERNQVQMIYKGGKFLKKLWCCVGERV